jgi:hypothetical protein
MQLQETRAEDGYRGDWILGPVVRELNLDKFDGSSRKSRRRAPPNLINRQPCPTAILLLPDPVAIRISERGLSEEEGRFEAWSRGPRRLPMSNMRNLARRVESAE